MKNQNFLWQFIKRVRKVLLKRAVAAGDWGSGYTRHSWNCEHVRYLLNGYNNWPVTHARLRYGSGKEWGGKRYLCMKYLVTALATSGLRKAVYPVTLFMSLRERPLCQSALSHGAGGGSLRYLTPV